MRFQSLKDGIPDVVVHPAESGDHLPIRQFGALVEDYLHGMAYFRVHVSADESLGQDYGWASVLHLLRRRSDRTDMEEVEALIDRDALVVEDGGNDRYFPVLIPILRVVKQPEGILIQRLTGGVWGQLADDGLCSRSYEPDPRVARRARILGEGECGLSLIFATHVGGVSLGESEDYLIKATPNAVERITDDEWQLVGEWASRFCENIQAAFTIAFTEDSTTAITPPGNEVFCYLDMQLCAGELAAVTP